jgi:hypothetical protein
MQNVLPVNDAAARTMICEAGIVNDVYQPGGWSRPTYLIKRDF